MKEPVPTGEMGKGVGLLVLTAEFSQIYIKRSIAQEKLNID